jgi:hypothetical protein
MADIDELIIHKIGKPLNAYHGAKTAQEGCCLCFILANNGIRILIVRLETKNICIEIVLQGGEADPVNSSVFSRCMPHDDRLQREMNALRGSARF